MNVCDLTLASPAENLACDEILLDLCEQGAHAGVLRFWEPIQYFIVLGYANRVATEVNREFCDRHDIPILRRPSGGGTVLQGPGCLNYSLALPINSSTALAGIAATNAYVLERHQHALQCLLQAPVERQGHTDLTVGGLKFSGNSQRRKKNSILFHGCFLLHADLALVEKALPFPSYQPDYRLNRSHSDFLMNLNVPAHLLKTGLMKAWHASPAIPYEITLDAVAQLAREKYEDPGWNLKF